MPQKFSIENPDLLSACILCTCVCFRTTVYNCCFWGFYSYKFISCVIQYSFWAQKWSDFFMPSYLLRYSVEMKEIVSNKIALNFMFCLHSETLYRFHGNITNTRVIRNFCTWNIDHTTNDSCKKYQR